MIENSYSIQFEENESPVLPSFTSSHTLSSLIRKPEWVYASEAVEFLRCQGINITTQTLFNMEHRNELKSLRLSPRKIKFDLNEITTILTRKKNERENRRGDTAPLA